MLLNSNHNISFQQFLKRLWKFYCLPLLILNILSKISWKIILWDISHITCESHMVWERDLLRYLLLLVTLMHAACLLMHALVWTAVGEGDNARQGWIQMANIPWHLWNCVEGITFIFLIYSYLKFNFVRYNLILKRIVSHFRWSSV